MTPGEKAVYVDQANRLGLSLGQFFREAGAAYASRSTTAQSDAQAEQDALEAALKQMELSARRAELTLDEALAEVRAALSAPS